MKRKASPKKSLKVKSERGFSPEEIAENGELLDVKEHPVLKDQYFEVYFFNNYVWVVVSGINPERLITAYKSRKLKKEYKK